MNETVREKARTAANAVGHAIQDARWKSDSLGTWQKCGKCGRVVSITNAETIAFPTQCLPNGYAATWKYVRADGTIEYKVYD